VLLLKMAYWARLLIAKLTRAPIFGGILYNNIFKDDRLIYLPMDRVIQINQSITLESMVLPSQVVEYFIEKATYHWIADSCICRSSGKCHRYPIDLGCIFLGEAAAKINSHLGHRVTKKEALEHANRCREAGLIHLIGRHKVDTLWLNVGPGDRLLTICNCCPCCCGWRVLPDFAAEISRKVTKMPGITVQITDACVGCGQCEDVCFVHAIHVVDSRAVMSEQCRGCGQCADVCPHKAIEIVIDNACIEKSISHISEAVDVS
jgi:ferredoxin